MNKFQVFQEFFATQNAQIPLYEFVINLILSGILATILGYLYEHYGTSLSNRRTFSRNFAILTMTTMIIISIVKSSLALSLGLVGALSIVRFRAAIKEPEELAFLFLAISIGLGLGAEQRAITIVGFAIIAGVIILKKRSYRLEENQNLHLTISSRNPQKVTTEQIIAILDKYCSAAKIKRLDETKEMVEILFSVEFDNHEQLIQSKTELCKLDDSIKISFLDAGGWC